MTDKEALQEIVFMVNDYLNKPYNGTEGDLVNKLIRFIEENVIHCAMDNNYK